MDLLAYLRAVRKNWWIVVLAALLGAGAGVVLVKTTQPRYASTVSFFASTPSTGAGTSFQADQYAQARVASYVKLLSSDKLAELVLVRAGLQNSMTTSDITQKISGSADLNTVLLTATAVDASPEHSLKLAQAVAAEFGPMITRLEAQSSKNGSAVILNVTSGPTLNPIPVTPRRNLDIGLCLGIGFLLGLFFAVLREVLDTSIRTVVALREATGRPVLGSVVFDGTAKSSPIVSEATTHSLRAESMRQLRTSLQFIDVDSPPKVVVVTSSVAGEGKSSTAANLAIIVAETGRRVLLMDADLRRPRVADYLGLERSVGLTDVLAGRVQFAEVVQPWGESELFVLTCGSIPPNPSELLGSRNMITLMADAGRDFDLVLIDTPPLLPVTDAAVVSAHADGVLLVVRQGKTSKGQLAAALNALDDIEARVLGTVLNMVPPKGPDGRSRYEGYSYKNDIKGDPVRASIVEPSPTNGPVEDESAFHVEETPGVESEVTKPSVDQSGGSGHLDLAEEVPTPVAGSAEPLLVEAPAEPPDSLPPEITEDTGGGENDGRYSDSQHDMLRLTLPDAVRD